MIIMKKIALITSGGDAPGMNACIRAITKYCLNKKIKVIAFLDGYQGVIDNRYKALLLEDVDNIIHRGGTILGTSRSPEFKTKEGRVKAIEHLRKHEVDAFICIGGDGTFAGARVLSEEMNIPVIGIPGTIDNDIYGTDYTIGYGTALNTVVEAVDKIRDTASSHHRIFFVEVMGRDAGFIALNGAIASGADTALIPEEHTDVEELAKHLKQSAKGRRGTIVIVAEGDDAGGAKEIMQKVAPYLKGYSLRHSVLGHIQRGGAPSAFDRMLATQMGVFAVQLLEEGKRDLMVCFKNGRITSLDIQEAMKKKHIPKLSKLELLNQLQS